jgi:outer membrane immunogenic protein
MKKQLISAVSLAALTGSALAADLPSRKEAVIPPPPQLSWTGFHVGVNAGGIWSNNNSINVSTWPIAGDAASLPLFWAPLNGTVSNGQKGGFIGGGQIGYDWQASYNGMGFVTGVEADIQGIAAGGGQNSRNSIYPGPQNGFRNEIFSISDSIWNNVTGSASLQYLGTVRGRIGYLATPTLLVYATGGLAYGGVSVNLNQSQFFNSTFTAGGTSGTGGQAAFGNANYSNTQVGYTAGGGIEWMFLPNWSAKAEYLYYNLGNVSLTSVTTSVPTGLATGNTELWTSSTAHTTISGNIVRAGVNYHFNWGSSPVVAKY